MPLSAQTHDASRPAPRGAWLVALVFSLTLVGYPVAGLLAAGLQLPSQEASIPFRLIVIAVSLALVVKALPGSRLRWPGFALLGFWLIYLLRLASDTMAGEIPGAETALLFFGAAVLIPCAALMLGSHLWRDEPAAMLTLAIGGLVSSAALAMEFTGVTGDMSLTEVTGRLSTETVNPITLGHVAVSALFAAYCLRRHWVRAREWLLVAGLVAILLACLIQTGSKGPVISLLAGILYLALAGQVRFAHLVMFCAAGASMLALTDAPVIDRFLSLEQDASTSERVTLLSDALDQIAGHPWFGSAFVELHSEGHPHNQVVEAAMALGIPLGALFAALCGYALWRTARLPRPTTTFLSLMFVQYFVNALLSGSNFANAAFWAALALLVNFSPSASRTVAPSLPRVGGHPDFAH